MTNRLTVGAADSPPAWLRTALVIYSAVFVVLGVDQGLRFASHSVHLSAVGPRKGTVIDLIRETAGVDEAKAKESVESISEGSAGRRAAVQVARVFSKSEAIEIQNRYEAAGAKTHIEPWAYRHLPYLIWAALNAVAAVTMLGTIWVGGIPTLAGGYRPPAVALTALVVGGVLGLSTVLALGLMPILGYGNAVEWRQLISFRGRQAWKTWAAWQPLVLIYAGLWVMFLSVLGIRSQERLNAALRRLLHGYTLALNASLLLGILVMVNIIVQLYGVRYTSQAADWTKGRVYSISDGSRELLRSLKQRVVFHVIFSPHESAHSDLEQLLGNFKAANPEAIDFKFYNPRTQYVGEIGEIKKLNQDYPWPLTDPSEQDQVTRGVLVVVHPSPEENDPERKPDFEFVRRTPDLYDQRTEDAREFKGERALISTVVGMLSNRQVQVVLDDPGARPNEVRRVLREVAGLDAAQVDEVLENVPYPIKEGVTREEATEIQARLQEVGAKASVGARQTIYITQENGEPGLDVAGDFEAGLGHFKQRLEQAGYSVKPLTLQPLKPGSPARIPRDASVVIVAGPRSLSADQVESLREYMTDPAHRLIVFLEPQLTRNFELIPSGLESFLEDFGVEAPNDLVIGAPYFEAEIPFIVRARFSSSRDSALVGPFRSQERLRYTLPVVRTVRVRDPAERFRATPLLEVTPSPDDDPLYFWTETTATLPSFMELYDRDRNRLMNQRLRRNQQERAQPFPIAVTVRRDRPVGSDDPRAKGDPCMVVFGDVTLVTNVGMLQQVQGKVVRTDQHFNIVAGCLGWLRDKPEQIATIDVQTRTDYKLKPETAAKIDSIRFYPGLILLVVIVLCGAGILLIRQRG